MVLSKVHQALGFERAKGWYSSAAPLSDDVFQYFQSLDMPIQVGITGLCVKRLQLVFGCSESENGMLPGAARIL